VSQDPQRWTTEAIPASDQFAFWRDVVWEAFVPVSPRRLGADGPFRGTVTARSVGALGVSRIVSDAQTVHRTPEQVKRGAGDVFFLNLPLTAGTRAAQDGRDARLAGGDFTLVDSTRPFELGFGESFDQLSFTIPHAALAPLLVDPEGATARRVRGDRGLGAVASGALRAAATATGPLDTGAGVTLGRHLVGLVALALGGVSTAPAPAAPALTPRVLLELARDEIERSLDDAELTPADVAARVGISTRYLHRLFSDDGLSFGRWLLARRLERGAEALGDPARAHWSVTAIALDHGFADPSYFARTFRARFGVTPRQWRASALSPRG
jgi:AraC family transcriptional regulator, positive regulator of tynA and feaB